MSEGRIEHPSIEGAGYPLVFRVGGAGSRGAPQAGRLALRTEVRALTGMQKEAVVSFADGGRWRMVSDEGPYLNGTDLAPFPLAFYTAGMQFSFLSQFLQGARAQAVDVRSVTLAQDNRYTMEGSFLRGDATGGAMPAVLELSVESDADATTIAGLARMAEASSGAQAFMRSPLANTFQLTHNDVVCELEGMSEPSGPAMAEPDFRNVEPAGEAGPPAEGDFITKVRATETVHGVEGGAGSSLKSEQKRTLHVHGEATVVEGMLMETLITLLKPLGSSFRFRCDEVPALGGGGTAPPPLAYLSAGVGFCFMTQLGRYAHIKRRPLDGYSLAQDTAFSFSGEASSGTLTAEADPVSTHAFVQSSGSHDEAVDLIRTGERTCFLHAAMRGSHPSQIRVFLNGTEIRDQLTASP